MIENFSQDVAAMLVANDIIEIDEMDAYRYGLELLIPKVILYTAILIFSLITKTLIISLIFVAMFMGQRRYSGGFHCKTAECCLCVSFLIYFAVIFGNKFVMSIPTWIFGVSSVISVIILLIFSPVEDKNRPLDNCEKKQFRLKSIIAAIVVLIAYGLSIIFGLRELSYLSSCSLTANAVLIILAIWRCKYEAFTVKNGS